VRTLSYNYFMAINTKNKKTTIAILGAGFGGLHLARILSRNPSYKVILIDQRDFHIYYPVLYEVASSIPYYSEESLRLADSFYIPSLLKGYNVTYVQGYIKKVDRKTHTVDTSVGPIRYDHIVMALGSDVNYYCIPGLKEHSFPLKSWNGILSFRKKMKDLVELAVRIQHDKKKNASQLPITIVVGGGGFSGVELACELAVTLNTQAHLFKIHKNTLRLRLIEAGPSLLAGLPEKVGERTRLRLQRLGVEVTLKSPIAKVDDTYMYMKSEGKRETKDPYNLLIWTGGIEGPRMAKDMGCALDKSGRFMSDQFLRVTGETTVWAIGDNACFIEQGQERPLPSQAYFALQQAEYAAVNIRRAINGGMLLPFVPKKKGFVVPLGGKYAIAYISEKIMIEGFLGWVARKLVDLNYFRMLVGWRRGIIFWCKELVIFSAND